MSDDKTPEIVIEIGADGNVNLEALNFEGPSCTDATSAYEKALGNVTDRRYKPQFRKTQNTSRSINRTQI